jgi:hypothetical protein
MEAWKDQKNLVRPVLLTSIQASGPRGIKRANKTETREGENKQGKSSL